MQRNLVRMSHEQASGKCWEVAGHASSLMCWFAIGGTRRVKHVCGVHIHPGGRRSTLDTSGASKQTNMPMNVLRDMCKYGQCGKDSTYQCLLWWCYDRASCIVQEHEKLLSLIQTDAPADQQQWSTISNQFEGLLA